MFTNSQSHLMQPAHIHSPEYCNQPHPLLCSVSQHKSIATSPTPSHVQCRSTRVLQPVLPPPMFTESTVPAPLRPMFTVSGHEAPDYCTMHTPDQQGGVYDCPHNVLPDEALGLLGNRVRWQLLSRVSLGRATYLTKVQWLPILEHTVLQIHCTCADT